MEESVVIVADTRGQGYDFARGVCDYIKGLDTRQFPIDLADIKRTEFRDGEYKLKITHNIRRKKCFFIHDSNKEPCKWFTDLVLTLDAMRSSSPAEITVVLPYVRFARQDRKDESRVSVSVKVIADIISRYADRGLTIDLHSPQIQEFFAVPFDNLQSYPVVINYLQKNYPELLGNLTVVSPDAGGGKRVESFQKRLSREGISSDMAMCYKKRGGINEIDEIKVMGDVQGKDCLILDDMIDTGGTLIKTAHALKQEGANKIFAYGTHGLFTGGIDGFGIFDKVMTSDTLDNWRRGNIEVVSMINLFGEAIYRTFVGESLSSLFE